MRAQWGAVAAIFLLGCEVLNPALVYQEAARQLNFSLERVEPSLQLAFPPQDSRVTLRLILAVDNPTKVRFKARHLSGRVNLEQGGTSHGVGNLSLPQGADITAGARSTLSVDLSFGYRDLEKAWGSISSVARGRKGLWRLDGEIQLDAIGIPITLPIHASKTSGE